MIQRNNKAGLEELYALHGKVAEHLAENLDDPKVLASAIKFLKDNNVTVDVLETNETQNLFNKISEYIDISKQGQLIELKQEEHSDVYISELLAETHQG